MINEIRNTLSNQITTDIMISDMKVQSKNPKVKSLLNRMLALHNQCNSDKPLTISSISKEIRAVLTKNYITYIESLDNNTHDQLCDHILHNQGRSWVDAFLHDRFKVALLDFINDQELKECKYNYRIINHYLYDQLPELLAYARNHIHKVQWDYQVYPYIMEGYIAEWNCTIDGYRNFFRIWDSWQSPNKPDLSASPHPDTIVIDPSKTPPPKINTSLITDAEYERLSKINCITDDKGNIISDRTSEEDDQMIAYVLDQCDKEFKTNVDTFKGGFIQ